MSNTYPDKFDSASNKNVVPDEAIGIVEDFPPVPMPDSLQHYTEAELKEIEKRLKRKADFTIMPIVGILYILNYIDRQNLAAAKLQGIMEDLNMSTTEFATAVSILFVGYLPFQIPSNLILSSITRPGAYICTATIIWGAISAATAAVTTYKSLLAVRVILGAVEAVFFPGVIYLLSSWYTKRELGKRFAGLYIAQQVGNAFGGLIAAGILKLDGVHGIRGWRWLFIIEGAATVGVGLFCVFFLPEYPYNARMLKPVERDLAVWRLEREAGASEANENIGTLKGFLLGLQDPKLYVIIFMNMMSQVQGSIANFFPSIVNTLGYGHYETLLLTAPPYVLAGIVYFIITWYSDRTNNMYRVILTCICIACATYIIALSTLNTAARYTAMMLMPFSSVGPQLMLYKIINQHLPRPIAKRAGAVAMTNAIGGISNIWMSYLFIGAPHYYPAFGALFAAAMVFLVTITGYRFYVLRENKKLDEGGEVAQRAMRHGITQQQFQMGWRYEGL
ncbi:MFS general substrate transporter [Aureobasidium pullulans]|nr:MFS general substrate transporter [Aureobasidium pullulans]